jgi:hypothetical protein
MTLRDKTQHAPAPMPWWRVRIVWLVVGAPLVAVVASLATLGIALTHPDPVLAPPPPATAAETPAMQARNHAAAPAR